MPDEKLHRRKFINRGAIGLAGLATMNVSFPFIGKAQNKVQPVRLAIIGTGVRGIGLAEILKKTEGVELVACCDPIEKNLKAGMALASPGAKAYTNHRKMLEDKNIDGVLIATPLYLHYPMALDALGAGKHMYIEKTMTYDIPQAVELAKRVKNSNLVVQVGHQYRNYNLWHKIKEMIDKGWLGDVLQYECQYHRNSNWLRRDVPKEMDKQVNWRMYREFSGGLMTELVSHNMDVINWMTGNTITKVIGIGGIDHWKDGREVFDNVRCVFEYPGGVKMTVSSILSNGFKGYSIRILGTKATIEVEQSRALIYPENFNKKTGTVDGVTGATLESWSQDKPLKVEFESQDGKNLEPTFYALADFATCIREGKKPFSNVQTGKAVAIAAHLGNLAMETGNMQYWKPEYSA